VVAPLSVYQLERMGQMDSLLNSRRLSGPGYVYLLNDEPVAAAGLGRVTGREFFAWVVMMPEVRQSKLLMRKLTREIKWRYPIIRDLIKAEIVQAETSDDPKFCRWLEMLGFERLPIARYGWAKNG